MNGYYIAGLLVIALIGLTAYLLRLKHERDYLKALSQKRKWSTLNNAATPRVIGD